MKTLLLLLSLITALVIHGKAPVKVISLTPALTDAVAVIGAVDKLCGRSRMCDAPGTAHIPVAGDMGYPAPEKVLALGATHVISDSRCPGSNWQVLAKFNIRTHILPGKKIMDYPANLRFLGELFDCRENAERAAVDFEKQIADLRRTRPLRFRKVLVVFAVSPVISCSSKTFIDEALLLAGAENICRNFNGSYFSLSSEFIITHPPEVIITAGVPLTAVRTFFSRPEFRKLPAVINNAFIEVNPDHLCRAGQYLPAAIQSLRRCLVAKL